MKFEIHTDRFRNWKLEIGSQQSAICSQQFVDWRLTPKLSG